MIDGLVAKRYAEALFEVANEKNILDQVEDNLRLFVSVVKETDGLMDFLRHPQIEGKVKKEIIESTFKDSINTTTKNFLFNLIDARRTEFIDEILQQYIKSANSVRGIVDADAITAVALDENAKQSVIDSLNKSLNKKVRLHNIVDPAILGGMIVKVGDRVYDGSISKQLKALKRSLTASRV